jgi:hypothetical protein
MDYYLPVVNAFYEGFSEELEKLSFRLDELRKIHRYATKGLVRAKPNVRVVGDRQLGLGSLPSARGEIATMIRPRGGAYAVMKEVAEEESPEALAALRRLSPEGKKAFNLLGELHEGLEHRLSTGALSEQVSPLHIRGHLPGVLGQETRILESLSGDEADLIREIYSHLRKGERHLPLSGKQIKSLRRNLPALSAVEYDPALLEKYKEDAASGIRWWERARKRAEDPRSPLSAEFADSAKRHISMLEKKLRAVE